MANVLIEESSLQDIADAIREKTGGSETYTAAAMGDGVRSIESGGGVETTLVDDVTASGMLYYTDANMTPQSGRYISGLYLPAGSLILVYNNGPVPPEQPINVTEIANYGSELEGQYIVYSVDTLTS